MDTDNVKGKSSKSYHDNGPGIYYPVYLVLAWANFSPGIHMTN